MIGLDIVDWRQLDSDDVVREMVVNCRRLELFLLGVNGSVKGWLSVTSSDIGRRKEASGDNRRRSIN